MQMCDLFPKFPPLANLLKRLTRHPNLATSFVTCLAISATTQKHKTHEQHSAGIKRTVQHSFSCAPDLVFVLRRSHTTATVTTTQRTYARHPHSHHVRVD